MRNTFTKKHIDNYIYKRKLMSLLLDFRLLEEGIEFGTSDSNHTDLTTFSRANQNRILTLNI